MAVGNGAGKTLYRAFRVGPDLRPICGEEPSMLGVRPGEIPEEGGLLKTRFGGMSVFEHPGQMPANFRPKGYRGGRGTKPVFGISSEHLGDKLVYQSDVPDVRGHGTVQPAAPTTFSTFQGHLCETRPRWTHWSNKGGNP